MRQISKIFLAFLGVLIAILPSQAIVLDWHEMEGGRIRLSFGTTTAKGEYSSFIAGLIEVELEEGWKTYWRNPGPSGMAPQLLVEGEEGTILFPFPSLIRGKRANDWSFGYQGRVTLPFILHKPQREEGDLKEISGSLHVGICKEICIPTLIDFRVSAGSLQDAVVVGRYEAVRDALDQPANEQFGAVVSANREGKSLILSLKVPEEELMPQLFVDAEGVGFGLPEMEVKSATADTRTYRVPVLSGNLSDHVMINYVIVGKFRTVSGGAILR